MRIRDLRTFGLITLLKKSVKAFSADDMMTYAAALAFSGLFALFPFLIFLITLLGSLNVPEFFDWILSQAESAMPAESYGMVEEIVREIQGQSHGGLLSFSILLAIWGASSGIRSVMNAMNVAYGVEESRPALSRYVLSVVYTLGLAVLLIVSAGTHADRATGYRVGGRSGWVWESLCVAVDMAALACADPAVAGDRGVDLRARSKFGSANHPRYAGGGGGGAGLAGRVGRIFLLRFQLRRLQRDVRESWRNRGAVALFLSSPARCFCSARKSMRNGIGSMLACRSRRTIRDWRAGRGRSCRRFQHELPARSKHGFAYHSLR